MTYIHLSIEKAKYEKEKISVPWKLSFVTLSTYANTYERRNLNFRFQGKPVQLSELLKIIYPAQALKFDNLSKLIFQKFDRTSLKLVKTGSM